MAGPFAVRAVGLAKRHGPVLALDRVSFSVPHGIIYGLLGSNGAGKTSTLDILCTLSEPSAGQALVNDHDVVQEAMEVRKYISVLPDSSLPVRPHWRVREYLEFFAALRGSDVDRSLVQTLGLEELQDRTMAELSAGQRRKVDLCRALGARAGLYLLDEPTKELDLRAKRIVWEVVRERVRRDGATMVMSSHDALEVKQLCRAVTVLAEGVVSLSLDQKKLEALTPEALERTLVAAMG